jgi:hypothetical protein
VNFAAGAKNELLKRELLQVFMELGAIQYMIAPIAHETAVYHNPLIHCFKETVKNLHINKPTIKHVMFLKKYKENFLWTYNFDRKSL